MTSGDQALLRTKPDHLQALLLAAGLLTVAATLAVMFGWYRHIEGIIRVVPGFSPMRFNTAGDLCLLGCSELAMAMRRRATGLGFASLAAVIGILTLSEHLTHIDQ